MFVFTRRSTLPSLYLAPGALVRLHADRLTLWPVSTTQATEVTIESLSGGGYGILANTAGHTTLLAHYPGRRTARHQLRRLAGEGAGRWRRPLGSAALAALLLFLVWFLFFVPSGPTGMPPIDAMDPALNARPTPPRTAVPFDDGPAFVDDPVERLREAPAAPAPE